MRAPDPIAVPADVRQLARKHPQSSWVAPMLATLVDEPFSREDWIFEPKLDGERCLTFRNQKNPRLLSRNTKVLDETYPELVEPLASQAPASYIADGEIVAFRGDVTSFSELQRRMPLRDPNEARRVGVEIFYYLFDLLYLNGYDLRKLLLGYYEGGRLKYAGKVGTGFDTGLLVGLGKQLFSLKIKHSPLAEEVNAGKGVHWVKPKLVAQVSFTEWTRDGRLRHPRFLGVRRDKDFQEVVRERPL